MALWCDVHSGIMGMRTSLIILIIDQLVSKSPQKMTQPRYLLSYLKKNMHHSVNKLPPAVIAKQTFVFASSFTFKTNFTPKATHLLPTSQKEVVDTGHLIFF